MSFLSKLILGFFVISIFVPKAYAEAIPREVAVRIILSEAADQGFKGMVCVGEVLRHRGSTKGFYGYQSNRLKQKSKALQAIALRAWEESAHTNYTKGADHFENIRKFGKPAWVKHCIKTSEYKDHVFYKEIRR